MNAATPTPDVTLPQQEEAARADMYGLLAMLYFNPPQAPLLDAIAASASQGDSTLGEAWMNLVDACRQMDESRIHDEYHQLFFGVSKPDVMLYGSYYQSGFLMEKPLAELRADLSALGLVRSENIEESEDHVASLFEVMRVLILFSESPEVSLSKQKQFYAAHIQSWIALLCDAIEHHPQADFYRNVANLTRQFTDIESQAFEMA
jgi:TorA maturation chaperone TorD